MPARAGERMLLTYTLIPRIDLLEAVRRYGLVGRTGTVPDTAALEVPMGPSAGALWLTRHLPASRR